MRIIGVTGGTGSGKSTVSGILAEFGASIVDADRLAREVVRKDGEALKELAAYFGREILREDGELDRKKLAQIVFNNAKKLEVLNEITHKYITERITKEIRLVKEQGKAEAVVLDVPIPVEHGFLDIVDEVWVVTADPETRIGRITARSGLSYEEAVSRINAQMKEGEYLRIADRVIGNNGDMEALKEKVREYYYGMMGDHFCINS